jgi:RNA polymerase sigma factor (sigma-70 family)
MDELDQYLGSEEAGEVVKALRRLYPALGESRPLFRWTREQAETGDTLPPDLEERFAWLYGLACAWAADRQPRIAVLDAVVQSEDVRNALRGVAGRFRLELEELIHATYDYLRERENHQLPVARDHAMPLFVQSAVQRATDLSRRSRLRPFPEDVDVPAPGSTVAEKVEEADTLGALHAAIAKLPEQARTVIRLCLEGKSGAEIARETGIHVRMVQRIRRDALERLKKLLNRPGPPAGGLQ